MTCISYGRSSLVVVLPLLANFPMRPFPAFPRPSAALLDVFLIFMSRCDPPVSRRFPDDEADNPPVEAFSPRRIDIFS